MNLADPLFWTALLKIIGVNIVLSGDNAVVIALAARSLPQRQQKAAIFWGSAAAIIMRVILTVFAVKLLQYSFLKLVGAVLLLWIGVKLLTDDDGGAEIESSSNLADAVKTILIADLVMSLDNVIAVAAAAKDDVVLLVIGLAISIPLIIFASQILLKLMERFPIIVTLGAALLGFVAGEMAWTDPAVKDVTSSLPNWMEHGLALLGAAFVVLLGRYLASRRKSAIAPGGT